MKARTTISIDTDLLKHAQENNYNVSHLTEKAIINQKNSPNMEEVKELRCQFCGEYGERENREDVKKQNQEANRNDDADHPLRYSEPGKLTCLYPDEKWICNKCLRKKCDEISACQ